MCFVDTTPNGAPTQTLAAGWMLTTSQFADVVAQENIQDPGTLKIDWTELFTTGAEDSGGGLYDRLIYLGIWRDHPVVTLTTSVAQTVAEQGSHAVVRDREHLRVTLNSPHPEYERVMALGLSLTHGLPPDQCRIYLRGWSGESKH